MPSINLSDAMVSASPEKKKEKKLKNQALMETLGSDALSGGKSKKESKLKKESKKRKALEIIDDDEERSETSSELVEPMNSKVKVGELESGQKKKKKAKVKEVEEEEEGEGMSEEHPNAVTKFRISEPLRAKLKGKGIESLFPIQAMTFDTVLDGSDLVGRARTGQVIQVFEFIP